jgi:N-acyl-D-amino-acid deacylase
MDPREFDTALGLLRESLEQGAIGLSTGLMYAPGSSAPREELLAMCALVAKLGKIYTTHMRSYSDDLLPSIEEQLNLARETGCRLQISHLQAVGQRNWKKQQRALELLEEARMEGVDVEFDSYPYLAGSTVLTQLLPQWALDGGTAALVDRLGNAALREQILKEIATSMPQGWNNIVVAGVASEARQHLVGNTIAELAEVAGVDASEFALDLIVAESAQVSIVSFNQSEENLRKLLTHPLCTVISDGFYVRGRPHPRLFGTFPALLGEVSPDRKWMPLAEAIYRITAKPADRFGLKHRGRIAKGYLADLVLFDACSVASRATYEAPQQSPVGIKAIYRAGKEIPIRE